MGGLQHHLVDILLGSQVDLAAFGAEALSDPVDDGLQHLSDRTPRIQLAVDVQQQPGVASTALFPLVTLRVLDGDAHHRSHVAQQGLVLGVELIPFHLSRDPQHAQHGGTIPGEDGYAHVGLTRFGADLGVFLAPDQVIGDASQFAAVLDVDDAQWLAVLDDPAGQPFAGLILDPLGGHLRALQETGGAAQDIAAGDVIPQEYGRPTGVEPVTGIAHDQRHQTIAIQFAVDLQQLLIELRNLAHFGRVPTPVQILRLTDTLSQAPDLAPSSMSSYTHRTTAGA